VKEPEERSRLKEPMKKKKKKKTKKRKAPNEKRCLRGRMRKGD